MRRRGGRKRALGTQGDDGACRRVPNERWSLDFLSDALADGRRFRILAIVEDFTRECLVLVPDTSMPGLRVVRELDVLIASRGRPAMCNIAGIVSRHALFLDLQTRPRDRKRRRLNLRWPTHGSEANRRGEKVAKPITVRAAPTKAMPSTSRM